MPAEHVIEIGDQFGKLTALKREQHLCADGKKRWKWISICECGTEVGPTAPAHLVNKIRSCKKCGYADRGVKARITGFHNQSTAVYRNYKASAKKRKIDFDLTYDEWLSVAGHPCTYCAGSNTSYFNSKTEWGERWSYTGVDRVNSAAGYQVGNVVPCCKVCNRAKSDMPIEEFLSWIRRVYKLTAR